MFVFPPVTRSSTHLAPFAALMCCQISLVTGDNLAQMTTSRVRWNHQIYTDWINSVYLNDTEKFPARFLSDRRPRVYLVLGYRPRKGIPIQCIYIPTDTAL